MTSHPFEPQFHKSEDLVGRKLGASRALWSRAVSEVIRILRAPSLRHVGAVSYGLL